MRAKALPYRFSSNTVHHLNAHWRWYLNQWLSAILQVIWVSDDAKDTVCMFGMGILLQYMPFLQVFFVGTDAVLTILLPKESDSC